MKKDASETTTTTEIGGPHRVVSRLKLASAQLKQRDCGASEADQRGRLRRTHDGSPARSDWLRACTHRSDRRLALNATVVLLTAAELGRAAEGEEKEACPASLAPLSFFRGGGNLACRARAASKPAESCSALLSASLALFSSANSGGVRVCASRLEFFSYHLPGRPPRTTGRKKEKPNNRRGRPAGEGGINRPARRKN